MRAGAVLALVLLSTACSRREELPIYGQVPGFQLTDQNGQAFTCAQLDGKVWVANFFFTTCTGPCPRMTAQMHQLQKATNGLGDVKLVSFTVDPAHDTPPVLAAYAEKFHADTVRWSFLTGAEAGLNRLSLDVFHLGQVNTERNHSTRFVLMDRRARIRGYYLSSDEDFMARLLRDVRRLAGERS